MNHTVAVGNMFPKTVITIACLEMQNLLTLYYIIHFPEKFSTRSRGCVRQHSKPVKLCKWKCVMSRGGILSYHYFYSLEAFLNKLWQSVCSGMKEHVTQCNGSLMCQSIIGVALHIRFFDNKKNTDNGLPFKEKQTTLIYFVTQPSSWEPLLQRMQTSHKNCSFLF